ncbi:hypothetical protein PR048_021469 [Dryococelus australis]|uniref:Transposable element Tc3 transposase n=1 Tax=Dryococelus australis TaxID=614101 RepID=A0ABQ9GYD1_9NEOP|nr:hypothetical protein PR048_021469 [Dryococelus australis]
MASTTIPSQFLGQHYCWRLLEPRRINGQTYEAFLKNDMPVLFENVRLQVQLNMYFMHDGVPAHFSVCAHWYVNQIFGGRWIGMGGPIPCPLRRPSLESIILLFVGTFKGTCWKMWQYFVTVLWKVVRQSRLLHRYINASRSPCDCYLMHVSVLAEGILNISYKSHDQVPIHTAGHVREWFDDYNIPQIEWLTHSHDLNPTEHLWDVLECRLCARPHRLTSIPLLILALRGMGCYSPGNLPPPNWNFFPHGVGVGPLPVNGTWHQSPQSRSVGLGECARSHRGEVQRLLSVPSTSTSKDQTTDGFDFWENRK